MSLNESSTALTPYYLNEAEQYEYAMTVYAAHVNEHTHPYVANPNNDALPDRLEKIFRVSFPQSNGSPFIQFLLQATAVKLVTSELGSADKVIDAVDSIELDPSKFYPPIRHVRQSEARLDVRIAEIWDIFKDIIHNTDSISDVNRTNEMPDDAWNLFVRSSGSNMQNFMLAADMPSRDLMWLEEGRPERKTDRSKYMSYFRSYVLNSQPTSCPEIDTVNRLTRETLKYILDPENPVPTTFSGIVIYTSLVQLARKWEEIHGIQFAPPDIDALLGKTLLDGVVEGDNWLILPKI